MARRGAQVGVWWVATAAILCCVVRVLHVLADDPLRPQYHVMPERFWMNDPNGPGFYNGMYHLFYQHNPVSIDWTNMHWGHSVSKDLVYWTHLPIALAPGPESYDAGGIWSGSMSFDPVTGSPIALYTGVNPQVQCMAQPSNLSDPYLTNWTKSSSNPFLPSPPAGFPQGNFRDPTTSWKSTDGSYYILVGSGNGNGGAALLYRSRTGRLIDAQYVGQPLTRARDVNIDGGMWECPDFYPIGNGSTRVLKVSSGALGHGDHYYTGSYNQTGQFFTPNVHAIYDYGSKFYASKSFLDSNPSHPAPRQILWAWINEADDRYAQRGWAGVQSLPRHITLDESDGSLLIKPIPELSSLRLNNQFHISGLILKAGQSFSLGGLEAVQAEILINFQFIGAPSGELYPGGSKFGLRVLQSNDRREQTEISLQGVVPTTKGLDLPGGDFRSLQVQINDYPSCEAACNADPLCHAWTLILGTPGRNNCWLKSNIPAGNPNPQTVSGAKGLLISNRTRSSLYAKADNYPEYGPLFPAGSYKNNGTLSLHVFVDHSIIEAYTNEGKERLTTRVYPTLPDSTHVELVVEGGFDVRINSLDIWQLNSIW